MDDDFSNFIQMFTVAVEIAKNSTIKYGRCALSAYLPADSVIHDLGTLMCSMLSIFMSCFAQPPLYPFHASIYLSEHSGYLRSNPLNTALEWRFTGGSQVTLEGNRGASDDIYCWLEVLGSAWTPHWDEFVRAIFDAWTAIEPNLKPHW